MMNDAPQPRRRAWRPRLSASKLFQAVRKAAATYPAPDAEPASSLTESSAKESSPQLQTQGKVQKTEQQITSTWSDMARSEDLAILKRQLEEQTSEYAELLKQHEFSLARVTSELSERSKQLQSAQTDAQQVFQQSKAQHADLLNQLQTAHLATQQARDAQVEAEQQLQNTQQASTKQLNQITAGCDQQVHAAKDSDDEESGERVQDLQQEYEKQLAAAMSEADQKMSALTTQLSQQLQKAQRDAQQHQLPHVHMQHQADTQLQTVTRKVQQQLEAEHQDRLKQLQQQLQACQQDCESLQAEKLVLEQQVQSAKADSDRDLLELRDKCKGDVASQMGQHSRKLEEEQSADKKAASRLQIEVAELQAALECQREDSVRREHQVLQQHMAGLAAKDTMVQQMWSQLHENKQGSRRFEVEAAELAAELRCTESQLGKAERDVKGWIVLYKRLVDDKISLVNERHHLKNRIASLEDGAATHLTGQHHNWQVVPPPRRPSTQSSPGQDVNAEAWPDTPRPSLPDETPILSDDNSLASAQLDYTSSPEPEQAISAPSLAAQQSVPAHTSETAVQGQHADSACGSSECHLEEEHANQTGGSNADQDSAHFVTTQVAATQADREEEVGDVEEEEFAEQDSAHMTITPSAADQTEEEEHDGPAEEEEYEQQPEPAQDPPSCDADEDVSGNSSEADSGGSSSENEEDDQEGKTVTMSSSVGSSGASTVPTPAVDAAGDQITGGLSAAIRPSPADTGSTNVSTGGPPAVPSFETETVGDAVVSLTAAAQHQESSITADSVDASIPTSSAQNADTFTPPAANVFIPRAGAAETSTSSSNKDDEEDEEHPVYDSLSEEEEGTGEEVSSSKEEDAAEEEAAETSEYEEDVRKVGEGEEEEEDVASDRDGESVAALHRKIRELQVQDSGWRAGYAKLDKAYTRQAQHLAQLQGDFARVWVDLLALQMVALDAVTCSQRPNGAQPRFATSPYTQNGVDMTHIKVIQHRLFNLMDADRDGVLSEEDVNTWVDSHLKAGTIDRQEVMQRKFEGSDLTDLETQPDWQLCGWVVQQVWQMLREMFAPHSQDPGWKGVLVLQFLNAQLGHDVGTLLCSPLEFLDELGGSRTSCIGSRFIQWGPLVQDDCSELDFTADEFSCCE